MKALKQTLTYTYWLVMRIPTEYVYSDYLISVREMAGSHITNQPMCQRDRASAVLAANRRAAIKSPLTFRYKNFASKLVESPTVDLSC